MDIVQVEIMRGWKNSEVVLSIICNTYNHESFIGKALESFLMQKTDFAFEILVHDDASTDNTPAIIKAFEDKFPLLIKPIYQTVNQFSQDIKPFGKFQQPRAKGKYIALCEGDDFWTDTLKLQKQVDFLNQNPDFSFVFHDVNRVDPENNELEKNISLANKFSKNEFSQEEAITLPFFINTLTLVYRNDFSIPDWFSELPMGDKPLLKLLGTRGKGMFFNEMMASYREHPGGITKTMDVFKVLNMEVVITHNIFIYENLLNMVEGDSLIQSVLKTRIDWSKYVIHFYSPKASFFYRINRIIKGLVFIKKNKKFKGRIISRLIFTKGISLKLVNKIFD